MKNGGNTFLISAEPPELCVAQVRDGKLFDLRIERGGRLLGDIFLGRVANVLPGMEAAFVDVGLSRNALLYAGDAIAPGDPPNHSGRETRPIAQTVKVGDIILVQVARPPVGNKGARVTMHLSLAGRFVVLSSHSDGVGISRRIENDDERSRLRRLTEKLRPLDHGLIVRTEAENVAEGELARDIASLIEQMNVIRERGPKAAAPARIHREMGLLGRLVRDLIGGATEQIVVDSPEVFENVIELMRLVTPHLEEKVTLYEGQVPLFKKYQIDRDLAMVRERIVPLRSGGEIVIDEAEALCAIDVNTAKFTGKKRLADTVLQTNLEAVEEAARQLRLRDIAGVIAIDFIDMERRRDSVTVLDALEAALKQDRAKTRIVQLSPSGLVEIVRRREGQSIRQILHRPCPYCGGDGVVHSPLTVAISARRQIRETAPACQEAGNVFHVTLHPDAATMFLGAEDEFISALEEATGVPIYVTVHPHAHLETRDIECRPPGSFAWPTWEKGTKLHLTPHAVLHPTKQPRFAIVDNVLVRLLTQRVENAATARATPAVLEIIQTGAKGEGRWYHYANVLTWHENTTADAAKLATDPSS